MNRVVEPELLDELHAEDARAIHSRRDLRRINSVMGNARMISAFLADNLPAKKISMAELGAGDGNIAFNVARRLSGAGVSGRFVLVDRQRLPKRRRDAALQDASRNTNAPCDCPAGWEVECVTADVFDWLSRAQKVDAILCNLFLHHFTESDLRILFSHVQKLCDCFVAAEPRRNSFAEWFARKVWLIGCNDVTCHDAEISVRAGFNDRELTGLWSAGGWKLTERRTGLFTHFFGAVRA